MTITDTDSVLVLGAGVSAPFGLSLGGDMISKLSTSIKSEVYKLSNPNRSEDSGWNDVSGEANTLDGFKNSPILSTAANFQATPDYNSSTGTTILEKVKELQKLLDGQTSETIDDFIVENPSYANLTKIGIASQFIQSCYDFNNRQTIVQPFSERYYPSGSIPGERNWVHLLINIIRHGIRSHSVSPEKKVKIVTFNYDKILEYILEKQFRNTEYPYRPYTDYIEILHMHGKCGDLKGTLSSPAETCLRWAKGIHVVNEPDVPEYLKEKRDAAESIIKSAREIYFCGFSFSGPNCKLLGLDSPDAGIETRLISYCNYDGNVGISKTVKKYERGLVFETDKVPISKDHPVATRIEEACGSSDKPLGISDWIKQGQLGELPG